MDKDSKGELWFKAKSYGWGWTPITWQGWALVLGYILIMVMIVFRVSANINSGIVNITGLIAPIVVGTGLLIFICYKKGEKPSWRWGKDK